MKKLGLITLLVSAATLVSNGAIAQSINGEVKKVEESTGKVTLQHGPIKKFDMNAMTMVYHAKDPSMLKGIKAGDKVTFDADKINDQFTVTRIQKTK